jgi:4-hydroxy-tetrahydrodipicolinate synthase
MKFEGIIAPVITPFHKDYSIDEAGYGAMLEHLIAQGVDAVVIGGTTGENYALAPTERVRQFAFGNEVIDGRLPWIAGVNDIRTEDVCALSVAARSNGASALLLGGSALLPAQ